MQVYRTFINASVSATQQRSAVYRILHREKSSFHVLFSCFYSFSVPNQTSADYKTESIDPSNQTTRKQEDKKEKAKTENKDDKKEQPKTQIKDKNKSKSKAGKQGNKKQHIKETTEETNPEKRQTTKRFENTTSVNDTKINNSQTEEVKEEL